MKGIFFWVGLLTFLSIPLRFTPDEALANLNSWWSLIP
jgi:hypothetical protein